MAKLSAHGQEIGTIYGMTTAKRYMSDGIVLKNIGFGWKLCAKVKPGIDPAQAFANAKRRQEEKMAQYPLTTAYYRLLHDLAGMSLRWKLHAAVSMMPDDPDGVWSEACDGYGDNCSADLDEVVELCRAFRVAQRETMAIAA